MVFGIGALLMINSGGTPNMFAIMALLVLGSIFGIGGLTFANTQNLEKSKPKQKLGMDMYSLIDDLIADLSPEEALYLKGLIDDAYKEDIDSSISELLEHRQARKM